MDISVFKQNDQGTLNYLTFTTAHVPRLQHRPDRSAAVIAVNRTRRDDVVFLRHEVMPEDHANFKEILIRGLTQLLRA